MSELLESQKKPASNFRKLLQERIVKANPRRNLTAEKLKRGENVQNRQLQAWLLTPSSELLNH